MEQNKMQLFQIINFKNVHIFKRYPICKINLLQFGVELLLNEIKINITNPITPALAAKVPSE